MTRMLVDPMRSSSFGDTRGCTGATMEDGTVYRANKRGHMEVGNPEHVRAMVEGGIVVEQKFSGAAVPGVTCRGCGFAGFPFHQSAPCPRCGREEWE